MRVTICQLDSRPGELETEIDALAAHVKAERPDFLLLPEMCFSAWLAASPEVSRDRWHRAVRAHEARIARLADLGVAHIMGTRPSVRPNGSRRNEAYIWNASAGARPVREKYYLPDEPGYFEASWYDRGEKTFDICRAGEARIGVLICTEMWFLEWARHYARSRVDLLCVPRVTPHVSVRKWLAGGQAAAVCAGAFCLSSNLWAPAGREPDCGGLGWVIDPDGEVLVGTSQDEPFATVEIDLGAARQAKGTYPRYVSE